RIGYPSELIVGEAAVRDHMRGLFGDWRAPGVTVCLHEHRGGFAHSRDAVQGLARKTREAGVQLLAPVEVTGLALDGSGAVSEVQTSEGAITAEQVVVAVGPWIKTLWGMLDLPQQ